MTIHLSRNGESIGTYSLDEIKQDISSGKFQETDLVWHEKLTDWITLKEFYDSLWKLEPASPDQLGFLASFGVTPEEGLTKGEASDLLEKLSNDPSLLSPSTPPPSTTKESASLSSETPNPSNSSPESDISSTDSPNEKEEEKADGKSDSDLSEKEKILQELERKEMMQFQVKFWGYTGATFLVLVLGIFLIYMPFMGETSAMNQLIETISTSDARTASDSLEQLSPEQEEELIYALCSIIIGVTMLCLLFMTFGAWGISFILTPGYTEFWRAWTLAFAPLVVTLIIAYLLYSPTTDSSSSSLSSAEPDSNSHIYVLIYFLPGIINWFLIFTVYHCSIIRAFLFNFLIGLFFAGGLFALSSLIIYYEAMMSTS